MERERVRDLWRESVSKPAERELEICGERVSKTCRERVRDLWKEKVRDLWREVERKGGNL